MENLADTKELLMSTDSIESLNDCLRETVPTLAPIQMERVLRRIFDPAFSRKVAALLHRYDIEYSTLEEACGQLPVQISHGSGKSFPMSVPADERSLDREELVDAQSRAAPSRARRQNGPSLPEPSGLSGALPARSKMLTPAPIAVDEMDLTARTRVESSASDDQTSLASLRSENEQLRRRLGEATQQCSQYLISSNADARSAQGVAEAENAFVEQLLMFLQSG